MRAELRMVSAEAISAEDSAREAMGLASSSGCQFVCGVAEAGQLLGLRSPGRAGRTKPLRLLRTCARSGPASATLEYGRPRL